MCCANLTTSKIQSFDLDADDAGLTLKQFARQAKADIVFDPESVKEVRTEEVSGMLLPGEALRRMLEGTPLVFQQDLESGAFAVIRAHTSSKDQATHFTEPQAKEETELTDRPEVSPPAETLRPVTGVQIQWEGGEVTFISIRGLDPTITKVTINGQSIIPTRARPNALKHPGAPGRTRVRSSFPHLRADPLPLRGSPDISKAEF